MGALPVKLYAGLHFVSKEFTTRDKSTLTGLRMRHTQS
jgi:hypothetical protein